MFLMKKGIQILELDAYLNEMMSKNKTQQKLELSKLIDDQDIGHHAKKGMHAVSKKDENQVTFDEAKVEQRIYPSSSRAYPAEVRAYPQALNINKEALGIEYQQNISPSLRLYPGRVYP